MLASLLHYDMLAVSCSPAAVSLPQALTTPLSVYSSHGTNHQLESCQCELFLSNLSYSLSSFSQMSLWRAYAERNGEAIDPDYWPSQLELPVDHFSHFAQSDSATEEDSDTSQLRSEVVVEEIPKTQETDKPLSQCSV